MFSMVSIGWVVFKCIILIRLIVIVSVVMLGNV